VMRNGACALVENCSSNMSAVVENRLKRDVMVAALTTPDIMIGFVSEASCSRR
jgi:hypothetical protein